MHSSSTGLKQLSFIIPHKGREDLLQLTLASIARQDYDLSRVEVVVVTQNQDAVQTGLSANAGLDIRCIHRPLTDTISALRNSGVVQSSATYLAFLDADVAIAPNWIDAMLAELLADPERVLVSAIQACSEHAPPLERIRTALSNAVTDTDVRFLPGRNLLLRRETFDRVGGFPEHLVTCEDYYFTDRMHQLGKLYYSSRAEYIHLGEDKVYGEMFRKEIWRGQSNLQSIKGRRIPLSEMPSFLVPVWILLFGICAVAAVLAVSLSTALYMLALALLPVLLYTLRLYRVAGGRIGFAPILQFYATYFPARIIGTFTGIFKVIRI